jgi:hypothetical protein
LADGKAAVCCQLAEETSCPGLDRPLLPFVSNWRVTSESADFTDLEVGPKSDQLIPANTFFFKAMHQRHLRNQSDLLYFKIKRKTISLLFYGIIIVGAESIG